MWQQTTADLTVGTGGNMSLLGGIVGGALGFLGARQTNASNAKIAAQQMQFEGAQAQLNRDFQERMSGTAHQREVTDLTAAGLNPILSATGGPGASTPSGAKGSGAGIGAVNEVGSAVSSAMEARRNVAEVKNIEADERLKDATRARTNLESNLLTSDYQLRGEQLATQKWLTSSAQQTAKILEHQEKGHRVEGEIDSTRYGAALRYMDRTGTTAKSLSSVLRR